MSENHSAQGRLDSWKEIADYLKRDVRTAMRWGKHNGMPVHRVPGGKRQAVFAYKEEIDAWLVSQSADNIHSVAEKGGTENSEPQEHSHGTETQASAENLSLTAAAVALASTKGEEFPNADETGRIKRWKWPTAVVVCLVLLFGAIRVLRLRSHAVAAVPPLDLARLTFDARSKGNIQSDGNNLYFNELEVSRRILVTAPVGGGAPHQINTQFTNVELQDISNDGRSLLVSSYEGIELQRPLWILPVQGGPPSRVGDAECRFARWSRDNRRIACAAGTTISVMASDGSNVRALGSFPGVIYGLIWSPDGERIRFALQDQQTFQYSAWEVPVGEENAPPGAAFKLPWGQDCCAAWTWTSDGRSFVYVRNDMSKIYMRSSQSTAAADKEVKLPISIGGIAAIAADKKSTTVYVLIQTNSAGQLLKHDTKQDKDFAFVPGLSAENLSYSRDGQWMTYTSLLDASLWRSRADGSDALRLTSPPTSVQLSSWSPDGRQIAFMANAPGKPFRIFLIGRDGGPMREAGAGDHQQGAPSWSPDGKYLTYGDVSCSEAQQPCWIRVLDLATKRIDKLPGSLGFRTARWSPDGKYIAALHSETHELMLFDVHARRWSTVAGSVTGDNLAWSSDSKYLYADSPQSKTPAIERFAIADGKRMMVMNLASLEKMPGIIDFWFGLAPGNQLIVNQVYTTSEIYALNLTNR